MRLYIPVGKYLKPTQLRFWGGGGVTAFLLLDSPPRPLLFWPPSFLFTFFTSRFIRPIFPYRFTQEDAASGFISITISLSRGTAYPSGRHNVTHKLHARFSRRSHPR